ncbi:scavenger receptor cysteine-rich type 1 protein M130-like [Anableps anableps]
MDGKALLLLLSLCSSDTVRLVNGSGLCSGRLEVKSDQLNQSWISVNEDGFDQKAAEVVCRELDCGPLSVLQGELFGGTEASDCDGPSLTDCVKGIVQSDHFTWMMCSDSVRLVHGSNHCSGRLEVKLNKSWSLVCGDDFSQQDAEVVCKEIGCGPTSVVKRIHNAEANAPIWRKEVDCRGHESSLLKCGRPGSRTDSVRLVNRSHQCAGILELKTNQSWSMMCENDFSQQEAKVACREIGCEPPAVLKGALSRGEEASLRRKEFQCEGKESALLNCRRPGSARSTCSPANVLELHCKDYIRLVGGNSTCAGTLEMYQGNWRPVADQFNQVDKKLTAYLPIPPQLGKRLQRYDLIGRRC